jgi:hypothetical protein
MNDLIIKAQAVGWTLALTKVLGLINEGRTPQEIAVFIGMLNEWTPEQIESHYVEALTNANPISAILLKGSEKVS